MRVVISCAVMVLLVQSAPAQAPITTDEMCESLEKDLADLDGKLVRFRMSYASETGLPEPPIETLDAGKVNLMFDCRSIMKDAGKKYRVEQTYVKAAGEVAEFVGRTDIDTWDGAQARTGTFTADDRGLAGAIDAAPGMNAYMEGHLTWQGWWVLQHKKGWTFTDLLRSVRCEGPKLLVDGTTEWIYHYEESPLMEASIIAHRIDGRPRLRKVEVRGHSEKDGQKKLAVSATTIWDNDWTQGLARSAKTLWRHFREKAEDEFWQLCRLELVSIEPAPLGEHTFRLAFKPGMSIADTRYRIGYTLGDTKLNLDGRLVRTAKPMEGDVGDNLEQWVREGEFEDTSESQANDEP
ncbi:MAG: hypothetical protein L0Y44_05490 [Phycisphaerales bacterium]|nr:hypothetical protein [Phycisphaerales bacterium]MCI0676973.1 hypothetical protein [Phycisphaerales bacterium]